MLTTVAAGFELLGREINSHSKDTLAMYYPTHVDNGANSIAREEGVDLNDATAYIKGVHHLRIRKILHSRLFSTLQFTMRYVLLLKLHLPGIIDSPS